MENAQPINSQELQSLLDNSSGNPISVIPEALTGLLAISLVISLGLMVVFVLFYIFSTVRKWKVQSAILQMQKDLAEIKLSLAKTEASPKLDSGSRDQLNQVDITSLK